MAANANIPFRRNVFSQMVCQDGIYFDEDQNDQTWGEIYTLDDTEMVISAKGKSILMPASNVMDPSATTVERVRLCGPGAPNDSGIEGGDLRLNGGDAGTNSTTALLAKGGDIIAETGMGSPGSDTTTGGESGNYNIRMGASGRGADLGKWDIEGRTAGAATGTEAGGIGADITIFTSSFVNRGGDSAIAGVDAGRSGDILVSNGPGENTRGGNSSESGDAGRGGHIKLYCGLGGSKTVVGSGTAGSGGSWASVAGNGGAAAVDGATPGVGGVVTIISGNGGAHTGASDDATNAGLVIITGGIGGVSTNGTDGMGGSVTITGGATGTGSSGNVVLTGGVATGAGSDGVVRFPRRQPLFYMNPTAVTFTANHSMDANAAGLLAGVFAHNTDANDRTFTLPTGTQMDALFGGNLANGDTFYFWLQERNAGNQTTLTAGSAGFTISGSAVVFDNTSAVCACTRTAANTWVCRIAGGASA